MMHGREKSDSAIVAVKPTNKAVPTAAEPVEPRAGAKGNARQQSTHRTQGRERVAQALERVRQAARQRKKERFTALLHHISIDCLRMAFFALKRDAASGVDGLTWPTYEADLDRNLTDLHERVHRGAYRALPSRRTYIPKADGKQRPLAVAALEDKIVQRATAAVLNAIYEEDFLGFSYGFRPKRGQHNALDALVVGITSRRVNFIFDADVASFFDSVSKDWLVRFVEHRIGDLRIIRLIQKWLKAGVLVLLSQKVAFYEVGWNQLNGEIHVSTEAAMGHRRSGTSESRFAEYVEGLVSVIGHADRAQPLRDYCTGLMMPCERKSVEPLAAVTAPARVAAQHQSLLHFVGEGHWSDEAVLAKVREMVLPEIERQGPIEAWIIDDTGFPKKGRHSVGVGRQYCGRLGKEDNCQVAVSLSLANHHASLPVAYRLYLPQEWTSDDERLRKAGVPDDITFKTKHEIALDQLRCACATGLPRGVVLMDAGYGNNSELRAEITALERTYVAGILSNTTVWSRKPSGK